MKDKLENFIKDNREGFNDLEPDPALWEGIKINDPEVKRINWLSIGWKVAAVVVIFISSYFFHYFMNRENTSENYITNQQGENPEELQMLIDAEAYYSSQIQSAEDQIYHLTGNNPGIKNEIQIEMSELDSIYVQLRNDLNDNVSNEEIIEAMIQNYRMKLYILEDVLNQLKRTNTSDDENKYKL